MTDPAQPTPLQQRAEAALDTLSGLCDEADLAAARPLVKELRNARDYPRMLRLAEAVARLDPADAVNRRLYAQALIESGLASAAVDVLEALAARLPEGHPERLEATGLLGRAWKQVFFDAADKSTPAAHGALAAAIAAYRAPYEADAGRTWHGVNLLALVSRARRMGLPIAPEIKPKALARALLDTLQRTPEAERDEWFLPTLAEASLGLGDWDAVEAQVAKYAAQPDVPEFLIASTLRQFSQVWAIEQDGDRGRGLVDALRARLLELPRAELRLDAQDVKRLQAQSRPAAGQLEAVLGKDREKTYDWWRSGVAAARSVAAVKRRLGKRIGTGFLVRAGDFGLAPADELLLLTNFHVVNADGQSPGIRPGDAQAVFEAADGSPMHDVEAIVWSAPRERQDASLLRLKPPPTGVEPMRIAAELPTWPWPADSQEPPPRVYVVGHPGGRELSFSFQDNELLGHEGPLEGRPPVAGVCRVHYRAPTEGGSSGSPVFNDSGWEVIALHHMGGELGMPRLNGEDGTYAANEGIAIRSIVEAIAGGK